MDKLTLNVSIPMCVILFYRVMCEMERGRWQTNDGATATVTEDHHKGCLCFNQLCTG